MRQVSGMSQNEEGKCKVGVRRGSVKLEQGGEAGCWNEKRKWEFGIRSRSWNEEGKCRVG